MQSLPPPPPAIVQYLHQVTIAAADETSPRNDTANVVELRDGSLLVVWHKYRANIGRR